MKTVAAFVALAGSAAAFAPAQNTVRSSALSAAFDSEIGAQPPLGFWDPLNLCVNADQARFDRLREVEIKHGRIAMMAIVGHMVTTAGYRFPGCEDVPAGLKAITSLPEGGLLATALSIGFLDFVVMQDRSGKGAFPGDYTNGLFGWSASEEEKREKRSIELNNGRAAQMGILGLMVHEQLTGEPYVLNAFLGYPTV